MAAVGGTMAGFIGAGIGTQLVAGAMIAGGVMTGIGAITGSKKLQKFGGLLSLAGGIGGLASGAWTTAASEISANAAQDTFRNAELIAQAKDYAGGAIGSLGGETSMGLASGAEYGAINPPAGGAAAGQIGGASAPQIASPVGMPSSVNLGRLGSAIPTSGPMPAGGIGGAGGGAGSGMLSDTMKWFKENPQLTQAGAGLLQSGLGAYGQQEALKEQMRLNEQQQARARQRMSDSLKGVTVPIYQRRGGG